MNILEHVPFIIIGVVVFIRLIILRIKSNRLQKKLIEIEFAYEVMREVLAKTDVEWMVIIEAKNGGGVPTFATRVKISVLYEEYQYPFKSIKESFQDFEVDSQINKLIIHLISGYNKEAFTHEMGSGLLKEVYEQTGAFWSIGFPIGKSKDSFIYGSMATSQTVNLMKTDKKWLLTNAMKTLQKRYKKHIF